MKPINLILIILKYVFIFLLSFILLFIVTPNLLSGSTIELLFGLIVVFITSIFDGYVFLYKPALKLMKFINNKLNN
jgi:hypothetical protein